MIKNFYTLIISSTVVILFLFTAGCGDQREEDTPRIENGEEQLNGETDTADTTLEDTSNVTEKGTTIPDITGTWTGKLDAHNSTLRITEQNGLSFTGRISTNFREVLNQEVSGEFDPDSKTLKMRDTHQARNMGTYSAKLSEDMSSMTGTFTITHDKKNFSFNYRKQQ